MDVPFRNSYISLSSSWEILLGTEWVVWIFWPCTDVLAAAQNVKRHNDNEAKQAIVSCNLKVFPAIVSERPAQEVQAIFWKPQSKIFSQFRIILNLNGMFLISHLKYILKECLCSVPDMLLMEFQSAFVLFLTLELPFLSGNWSQSISFL